MGGRLYVDFCGDERVVDAGGSLSFGRTADLVIDDNPYMHRVLGAFDYRDGHWLLFNEGSHTTLNVLERRSQFSGVGTGALGGVGHGGVRSDLRGGTHPL
ncbi:MAG: hypothetical protein R2789_10990 [Microthrixaceae bacterium]